MKKTIACSFPLSTGKKVQKIAQKKIDFFLLYFSVMKRNNTKNISLIVLICAQRYRVKEEKKKMKKIEKLKSVSIRPTNSTNRQH